MDELAEREGIQPQPRRKWATFLYAFGCLAFAIAPVYSTFIKQDDFVSCHAACLLMLHCALSRRVVKGELQVPQDRLWLLREMAQATVLQWFQVGPHTQDTGNALGGVSVVPHAQICRPP